MRVALLHVEFDAIFEENQVEPHVSIELRPNSEHRTDLGEAALDHRLFDSVRRGSHDTLLVRPTQY